MGARGESSSGREPAPGASSGTGAWLRAGARPGASGAGHGRPPLPAHCNQLRPWESHSSPTWPVPLNLWQRLQSPCSTSGMPEPSNRARCNLTPAGSPSRPKDGSLLGWGPHQSYCAVLNLLVLSHLIKCLNRPDKTEKWDFKKKKKKRNQKEGGVRCFESPLMQQPALWGRTGSAPGRGMPYSTAGLCLPPKKPRPGRKRPLHHPETPPAGEARAVPPARGEGRHEEGGRDGIYATHAIKLGLARAELLLPT